jgi:hypothetical protein
MNRNENDLVTRDNVAKDIYTRETRALLSSGQATTRLTPPTNSGATAKDQPEPFAETKSF